MLKEQCPNNSIIFVLLFLLVLTTANCVPAPVDGVRGLQPYLQGPAAYEEAWQEQPDDEERGEITARLLAEPLDIDAAVRIALLNNPGLQADLQEINIVASSLRQGTVLRNPELASHAYFFEVGQRQPERLDTGLSMDLGPLVERAARVRAVSAGIDVARARAAGRVIDFIDEVRRAWIDHVAAGELLERHQALVGAAALDEQSSEIYFDAGTIAEDELYRALAFASEARRDLHRAENRAFDSRERLHELLGVDISEVDWSVPDSLPDPPEELPETEVILEQYARERSVLLRQFDHRRQEQDALLRVALWRRWLPDLAAGIAIQVGDEGIQFGPTVGLGIPLFNRFRHTRDALQAEEIQLGFAQRQEERRLQFSTRRVDHHLRQAHRVARQFPDEILPLYERLLEETIGQYEERNVGVFELLQARHARLRAQLDYVEARREYWLARTEYEHLIAGGSPADPHYRPAPAGRHAPLRLGGVPP